MLINIGAQRVQKRRGCGERFALTACVFRCTGNGLRSLVAVRGRRCCTLSAFASFGQLLLERLKPSIKRRTGSRKRHTTAKYGFDGAVLLLRCMRSQPPRCRKRHTSATNLRQRRSGGQKCGPQPAAGEKHCYDKRSDQTPGRTRFTKKYNSCVWRPIDSKRSLCHSARAIGVVVPETNNPPNKKNDNKRTQHPHTEQAANQRDTRARWKLIKLIESITSWFNTRQRRGAHPAYVHATTTYISMLSNNKTQQRSMAACVLFTGCLTFTGGCVDVWIP